MNSESWPNVEAALQFFCELKLFLFVQLKLFVFVELKLFSIRQTQAVFIYIALNCSYLRRTQLFLFTSNSTVLIYVKLNCPIYIELNVFLLRRTPSVLLNSKRVYSTPSVALSSIRSPWIVQLFCNLHSVQERHCILYQVSTLLCRLWTLHYSATLKYHCAY